MKKIYFLLIAFILNASIYAQQGSFIIPAPTRDHDIYILHDFQLKEGPGFLIALQGWEKNSIIDFSFLSGGEYYYIQIRTDADGLGFISYTYEDLKMEFDIGVNFFWVENDFYKVGFEMEIPVVNRTSKTTYSLNFKTDILKEYIQLREDKTKKPGDKLIQ